jgi:uncharacterized membrane protein
MQKARVHKSRINISVDQDLARFIKSLAAENRTTVADIMTQYILALKRRRKEAESEMILSHPSFRQALDDVRARLKSGSAKWRTLRRTASEGK